MENKIDTQGMSGPASGKSDCTFTTTNDPVESFGPRPDESTVPLYSDLHRKELKAIIIEALNEWSSNK